MSTRQPMIDGTVAGPDTPLEDEPPDYGLVDVDRPIPTREGGISQTGPPVPLAGGIPSAGPGLPRQDIPFPYPTPGSAAGSIPDYNAQNRARVMSAMVMHFGGEQYGMLGPDELDPVVDRAMEVFAQYPQLYGMLEDDLNTVLALNDDQIAQQMAAGGGLFTQSGPVMDSIAEVFYASGAEAAYSQYLAARTDTLKGDYENLLNGTGDELRDVVTDLYGYAGLPAADGDALKAQSFTNQLMHQPGMWVLDPATNRLLIAVTDRDGEQRDWEIQLDPGTRVNNTLDALSSLIQAEMGSAHTITRGGENLGAEQEQKLGPSPLGFLTDTLTNAFNKVGDAPEGDRNWNVMFTEGNNPVGAITPSDSELQEAASGVEAQLAHHDLSEEYLVGIAARVLRENPDVKTAGLSGGAILDLAGQIVEEDGDRLAEDWKNATRSELIADATANLEDRGTFGRGIDKATNFVMDKMVAWDSFTNWIGTEGLEAVGAATAVERGSVTGMDPTELKQKFDAAREFERHEGPEKASQLFGIDPDDDMADVVDLVASVVFDPTNYIFGGGKFVSNLFRRGVTEAKFAPVMLKSRPVRAVVKHVASENVDSAVRTAWSTRDLTDEGYERLVALAHDPQATREAVEEVFHSQLPSTEGVGFWLGHGLDRVPLAQTAQGMGHHFKNWKGLPGDDKFYDMFTVLSRERTIPLNDTQFMNGMLDRIVPVHVDDPDEMTRWGMEMIRAKDPTRAPELGSVIQQKQSARTSLNQANYAAEAFDLDAIPRIDGQLDQVRGALATIDQTIPDLAQRAPVVDQLTEMYRGLNARRTGLEAVETDLAAQGKQARRQLNKVDAMEYQALRPETRAPRVHAVTRWYDSLAEELGLPKIPGAKSPVHGGDVYDWSRVTGGSTMQHQQELELAFAPFGTDPEDLKLLHGSGFLNRMASMPTPASPYEIIAYRVLGGGTPEHNSFLNTLRLHNARKVVNGMKGVWAYNLLFNPISAFRAHLDEPLRFLTETGDLKDTARAILPASADRFMGGEMDNPWAAAYQRNQDMYGGNRGYQWMDNPRKTRGRRVYLDAVDRFINGNILNDDMFQHYARERLTGDAIILPGKEAVPLSGGEWTKWWDEAGWTNRRKQAIKRTGEGGEKIPMDAPNAFNQIHRAFEFWLENGVDAEVRDQMRRRVLEEAVTPGGALSRTDDAALMRGTTRVPGVDPRETGFFKSAFDAMWGTPARRRGSVFFDHWYEEAMDLYETAYRNKGLLLTEDMLVKLGGVPPQDAAWMLRQGMEHPVVRRLVTESGAVTKQMMESHAASYAAARADSIMYQMTAATMIGRGAENIIFGFPFLRAHMDFMAYWGKHLTTPSKLRVPEAARLMPGIGKAINTLERVPINTRAMAKWAHLTGITNNDNESVVDQAIDNLTFFPTQWGNDIIGEFLPTPGPLPSWLVDMYMTDEDAQQIVNTIWPRMAYSAAGAGPEDFFDYALPASRKSMRRMLGAGWRFLSSIGVTGDENLPGLATGNNLMSQILSAEAMPAGGIDQLKAEFGEYLATNALATVPGSDAWNASVDDLTETALKQANRREAGSDALNIINPMSKPWEPDHLQLATFAGFMDEAELLIENGVWDADDLVKVDPATGKPTKDGSGVAAIQWAWGEYEAGRLEAADRDNLENVLRDQFFGRAQDIELTEGVTLRDWLIFQHPELAINLASSTMVSDQAPKDFQRKYALPDGRVKSAPGHEGVLIYKEGWAKGWLTNRDPGDIFYDAHSRVYSSTRKVVESAWQVVTGLEWGHSEATYASEGGRRTVLREHRDKRVDWDSNAQAKAIFEKAGITVSDGMTYQQLREAVEPVREGWKFESEIMMSKIEGSPSYAKIMRHDDPYGAGLMTQIKEQLGTMEAAGYPYPSDWPEEHREAAREGFRIAVNKGFLGAGDYQRDFEFYFGPLDYERPVPPPVDSPEITQSIRFTGKEVNMGDVAVLDGDTLSVVAEDGNIAIRLIGINAPDNGDPDYTEATKRLRDLINQGDEVRLVQWRPEDFGATTTPSPTGEQRLLMWLYVDGVPIYDPTVFSSDNERGAAVGGTLLDYAAIYAAGQ